MVYAQENFVYGQSIRTEDGLSIHINYGQGKLLEVILPDCRECSIVEITLGKELDGLVADNALKPIVRGITSWVDNKNQVCYQIKKSSIKIDNSVLVVPHTKKYGCK